MTNRKLIPIIFSLFLCLGLINHAEARIVLPSIFGNNMVLQRNSDVTVWGTAEAKRKVTVTTSWNGKTYETKAETDGKWRLKIQTPQAGGPYQIDFSDGEKLTLSNVLIGEVWVCSGQSNMERALSGTNNDPVLGANEAILRANNQSIRLFEVKNEKSTTPKDDFSGKWDVCSRLAAADFSATGYFFGNLLLEILDVPVGLIESDWGGTEIQLWMDEGSIKTFDSKTQTKTASQIYNAMIYPMLGLRIRGVIWYQGESNRKEPEVYDDLFIRMVESWREKWGIGAFPFYYCQIAPFGYKDGNSAYLREAQLAASKKIPNSGMVSLMDAGDEHTIHPPYKRMAGERLAYFALKDTYGVEGIEARAPEFQSMTIKGAEVELLFNENLTSFGKELSLFELAGADKKFYKASARISGSKVILSATEVPNPVAARYAFKNFVVGDLYNLYGLPASSFRTDDWEDGEGAAN
jgi:sialate O-acetylesterase